MPKKTFSVDDFSGGANTFESPQNVAPNELVKSQGFYIIPGEVGVIGDMKGAYTIGSGDTAASGNMDIESGYGLFTFSHDYDMASTDAGTNVELADTSYFVMMARDDNDSHNKFDVYDTADHTWRTDKIDLGGSASSARMTSIKPCFFMADGAIRISPGLFTSVDSGEDLTSTLPGAEINYGGFDTATLAVDGTEFLTVGDTIIISGQECIVLLAPDSTANTYARNMTGLFPSAITNTTAGKIIYVMPDTRWRGVVKRKNFSQAGTRGTFIEWYSTYAHPRPPVTYNANLDAGAVSTQYTMPFLVQAGTCDAINDGSICPTITIVYKLNGTNVDATWDGASINLYCTALYDELKQESQPNQIASGLVILAADELGLGVMVNYADGSASPADTYLMNKRVTGARLYYEDSTNDPGILFQLLEIDFEKGCKKSDAETFDTWISVVADECVVSPTSGSGDQSELSTAGEEGYIFANPPKTFTYEINTGYPPDINTHARYKTAVILNRRLFAGNVYQSGKANGDRMIGSPVNKFDILPETNTIDVTVGDGDQIVKLEGFADRILQFKKRILYIINVGGGQGGEFLESQHKNMGVQNPSQTCLTEYGVAWVNSKGVFLFDGQQVTDLTRNKLQLTSSTRGEALNVDEDNIPIIGYHPVNKWLVIHPQSTVTDANDVEAWILEFKSGAWTYSNTFTTTDDKKTNMIWTGDDELVFAAGTSPAHSSTNTPDFFKYQVGTSCNDAGFGATTKLELLTKEFDLELPGVKKTLKSIHVTYSAAANSSIEADIIYKDSSGQSTVALEEEKGGSTYYTEALGFKSTSSAIRTVRLTPVSSVKKAYTFQLKLHNPDVAYAEGADFKLYNISFTYRMLGAK